MTKRRLPACDRDREEPGSPSRDGAAGFTLLEVTIALLVVAMAFAIAIPGLDAVTSTRMRSSAGKLSSEMRAMYAESALNGRTCRMVFDLDQRAYWAECAKGAARISSTKEEAREGKHYIDEKKEEDEAHRLEELAKDNPIEAQLEAKTPFAPMEGGSKITLPDGVSFDSVWVQHQAVRYTAGDAYVYFFPQGNTEHAIVGLKHKEDILTLESNPLTGRVVLIDGPLEIPKT